jgi:predicted acyl esterase
MSKPGMGHQVMAADGQHRKGRDGRWLWRRPLFCALLLTGLTVPLLSCSAQSATAGVSRTGYITVSGGIKLAYDLTLPAATGRFPVAFEYNHYSAGADNGAEVQGSDAGLLLAAGFAVLGVNEPGSGCSGGVDDYADVNEWGRAGAEVVEWAASRPWSTGHIGMFGSSWSGITQIGIASFRPKGLDAIAPFHIAADFYRDVAYPGGVYNAGFLNYYSSYLVTADEQAAHGAISHGDKQCAADYQAHVAPDKQDSLALNAPRHPFDDSYWQTGPGEYISRIDIPVMGCQSWQDGLVSSRATELYYDAFQQKTSWFIGMNGAHGSCDFTVPLDAMVKFLRYYVAGGHDGWPQTPHVTILHEVSGGVTSAPSPAWVSTYQSWSQLMKPVTLYFQPNRALTATRPGGSGQASFSGPAPSQSGSWTKSPKPGTSVSYTTPPLAHDVDFFGPGSVNLWLSSTAPDTDIEVVISEVRPDGSDQYVQAGWLNVAQRALAPPGSGPAESSVLRPYQIQAPADRQPLVPGKPVYARVELMPFEHLFRKGTSIRITIDSASGPVQSTGLWGMTAHQGHFTGTIYVSPAQLSQVVLGLIPGAKAQAPIPACGSIAGEPCRHNQILVPAGHLNLP